MNTTIKTGIVLSLVLGLAACSDSTKKTFGLEANPPDAFDVGTQAPLSLPPELGSLPPPNPGEPRPQQVDAAQEGLNALSPASSITPVSTANSAGQQALLAQAGPTPPAGIRAQVNQSALIASKPPGFVSSLLGAGATTKPATVDAAAEQQRIQQDEALGEPPTAGETPQSSSDENEPILNRLLDKF
jgi:hypothetical protein